MSAYKARQVIDTIRGKDVGEADALLRFTEREAARVIRKCLRSAVANAANNDGHRSRDPLRVGRATSTRA